MQRVVFAEEMWDLEVLVFKVGVGVGIGPKPQGMPLAMGGRMNLGPCLPWRGRIEEQSEGARHTKTQLLHSSSSIKSRILLLAPIVDDSAMYYFLAASRRLKPDSICAV